MAMASPSESWTNTACEPSSPIKAGTGVPSARLTGDTLSSGKFSDSSAAVVWAPAADVEGRGEDVATLAPTVDVEGVVVSAPTVDVEGMVVSAPTAAADSGTLGVSVGCSALTVGR